MILLFSGSCPCVMSFRSRVIEGFTQDPGFLKFRCMDGELLAMDFVVEFHLRSEASPVCHCKVPARAGR